MTLQIVTMLSIALLTLVSCNNEDLASNRGQGIKQTIQTEPFAVVSGIHRERGTSPLTYVEEIKSNSNHSKIRAIPDIRFDDDGADGKNVSTRTSKIRPSVKCGQGLKESLKEKIADCAQSSKNGDKASWNGTIEAGSSEGSWSLISLGEKTNENGKYEIWLDKRTGMVWSDIISEGANWCQASGNQNVTSDDVGENCAITGKGQSLCTNYDPAELPGVTWRLPTRHDYLQADLDGIRFVLERYEINLWTATTSTDVTKRNKAWTYNMTVGSLIAELMNTNFAVRCIGTPNF